MQKFFAYTDEDWQRVESRLLEAALLTEAQCELSRLSHFLAEKKNQGTELVRVGTYVDLLFLKLGVRDKHTTSSRLSPFAFSVRHLLLSVCAT